MYLIEKVGPVDMPERWHNVGSSPGTSQHAGPLTKSKTKAHQQNKGKSFQNCMCANLYGYT